MATFVFALIAFAVVMAGMAVGVIFSNKPIQGSCGGLNKVGIDGDCEICGGDLSKCEESSEIKDTKADLTYDATKR